MKQVMSLNTSSWLGVKGIRVRRIYGENDINCFLKEYDGKILDIHLCDVKSQYGGYDFVAYIIYQEVD